MRRAAYVEWLRAARLLVTWPIDEPPPPPSGATVPHPRMLLRLAEAVADVELVGSTEVVRAARVYLDKVYEVGRDLSRKGSYNDVIRGIDEGLKPDRHAVIDLMRRDLKSRR